MMKIATSLTIAVICATLFAATNSLYTDSCASLEALGFDMFHCTSGADACTYKDYECDSIIDCPDSSDEDHCATQHAENCDKDFDGKTTLDHQPLQKFTCNDGMCILGCQRCDNIAQCVDASDEIGCTGNEIIPPCY